MFNQMFKRFFKHSEINGQTFKKNGLAGIRMTSMIYEISQFLDNFPNSHFEKTIQLVVTESVRMATKWAPNCVSRNLSGMRDDRPIGYKIYATWPVTESAQNARNPRQAHWP